MDGDFLKLLEGATAPAVYLFAAWYLARRLDAAQDKLVGTLTGVIQEATVVMREVQEVVDKCRHK